MGNGATASVMRTGQTICLALTLTVSMLLPVKALSKDAIDAMFSACAQPGLTAEARLDLINDAGWRTAGDTPATRKLLSITNAIRFPLSDDPAKQDNLRAAVLKTLDATPEFISPPGQPVGLDDVLDVLASSKFFETFLVHPESAGLTRLIVARHSDGPDLMIFSCKTALTAPDGDGRLDGMLQVAGTATEFQSNTSVLDPGIINTTAMRDAGGDDGTLRLFASEFAPTALHNTVFNTANLGATISLYVDTIHGGFSLR